MALKSCSAYVAG